MQNLLDVLKWVLEIEPIPTADEPPSGPTTRFRAWRHLAKSDALPTAPESSAPSQTGWIGLLFSVDPLPDEAAPTSEPERRGLVRHLFKRECLDTEDLNDSG